MQRTTDEHVAMHFDDAEQQFEAAQLGMWLFLATEILFFGGLFAGYTLYRAWYPHAFADGSSHLDYWLGTINTGVLLTSSLTMVLAVHAAQTNDNKATRNFLIATMILGSVFLGVKAYEYWHKWHDHLVPGENFNLVYTMKKHTHAPGAVVGAIERVDLRELLLDVDDRLVHQPLPEDAEVEINRAPAEIADLREGMVARVFTDDEGTTHVQAESKQIEIFFSFYFGMTGLHALHMVIGMGLLAIIAVAAHKEKFSAAYFTPVEIIGLYWHFVDIVWVFLFPLLYLIG